MKINISEMNGLIFKVALVKDKRPFLVYYFSLLKVNHPIIYIFYTQDYNSQIIKLSIFLFNISSFIAVNALFYNDSTMHKIYIGHGAYNFVFQLPQIIYSAIISGLLNSIIKILGLSEKNVLKFKRMKISKHNVNEVAKSLFGKLKIKFFCFYFLIISLLGMFWYYVTCFCGIYRNTQIHLIKDSLCSFASSLCTPFLIYILPGVARIYALKKNLVIYTSFHK